MEWISVKDKKPNRLKTVIFCTDLGYVTQGFLGRRVRGKQDVWHELFIANQFTNVVDWMPLPKPRKNKNYSLMNIDLQIKKALESHLKQ